MKYRNKNDVPYFKFKEFSNSIEGREPSFVLSETLRIFNPDSVEDFSKALEVKDAPIKLRFRLNLKFKTAGSFIDVDTYFNDMDHKEFFKLIIKRSYFRKKINFDKLSLAEAEYIFYKFREIKLSIREQYKYLYNPPMRASVSGATEGSIARSAFAEHYGSYMEMIYVLCKGDFTKFPEIIEWDLHRFLFQAEYLIRKKDIENLK